MAEAKEIVAGVGTRYGVIFPLNADGIPNVGDASADPTQGTLVHGIKNMNVTDPEPRRFNHAGDDHLLAQDSLPAITGGNYSFETAASNFELDNTAEGTKTKTLGNNKLRAGNNSKRGNEPLVMSMIYRQALDLDPDSDTYGKLRQWHGRIYPANRVSPQSQAFAEGETNKVYNATPTPVKETPWGESIDETDWGAVSGEYIEIVSNYHPRLNFYKGNGTLDEFNLSHPPADSSELVIINTATGAELTPTGVNTSSNFPSFTLGAAVGDGVVIMAWIGTDEPGSS